MRLTRFTISTTLLPLIATLGCASQSDDDLVVRDSAGIRIVESGRPEWREGEGWRVGEPVVTIGADEDEAGQQLERVVGATRSSNGVIIVAEAGAPALLRYDSLGRFLGSIGRAGEGPGEFRALEWLGRSVDDSLITWDRGLGRIYVFDSSGALGRQYEAAIPELPMSLVVRGMAAGGRLLLSRGASFISAEGREGVQRQPITAWMVSPTGEVTQSFGPFPGEAVNLRAGRTPNSTIRTPVPYGASTLFAGGADAVYVVDTDELSARVYGTDGQLRAILRRPFEPVPVRPEDVAAYIDERLSRIPPDPSIQAGARMSLESVPPAEYMPAVRAVRVDAEGYLWLEAGRQPADSQATWSVFEADGPWLGDVMLPARLTPLEIGRDYILASDRDDLDVPRVHLLPLMRTGR